MNQIYDFSEFSAELTSDGTYSTDYTSLLFFHEYDAVSHLKSRVETWGRKKLVEIEADYPKSIFDPHLVKIEDNGDVFIWSVKPKTVIGDEPPAVVDVFATPDDIYREYIMEFANLETATDFTPEICQKLADQVSAEGTDGDIDSAIATYLEEHGK